MPLIYSLNEQMIYSFFLTFLLLSKFILLLFLFIIYLQVKRVCPEANLRLPGKKIFGNLDPEFIQQRREGLDEFIKKLIQHPRLSQK